MKPITNANLIGTSKSGAEDWLRKRGRRRNRMPLWNVSAWKKKIEGYIALLSLDSVIYFYNHFIPL
jgi:DNA polymerase/3'-5' exonuclease PolX